MEASPGLLVSVPTGRPNATGGSCRSTKLRGSGLPVRQARLPALFRRYPRVLAHGRLRRARPIWRDARTHVLGRPGVGRHAVRWLLPRCSTLLAGASGVGKTLLALHFIFAGTRRGETGVIATVQENPAQLKRSLKGFSWSLDDPGVELMYRSPVDLYLDEWLYDLLDTVRRAGTTRVAIDSLGDLRASCGDELRFREYICSLPQRGARANVSVVMTQEVPDLFGVTRSAEYGISHLPTMQSCSNSSEETPNSNAH